MKKQALIAVLVLLVLAGVMSLITSTERAGQRKALADYMTKLRAQGEILTPQEAGYPFPLETNANLENFAALADRMRARSSLPGELNFEPCPAPGRLAVAWQSNQPPMSASSAGTTSRATWADLASDCAAAAESLAALRAELERPPRRFGWNYTNPFSMTPKNPFVQKRAVAQFLAADTFSALHERELARAQTNLHSLTQLALVHRDDPTLISAMMRVAISGLGPSVTWQALHAEGWDEAHLRALQHDWEAVDLAEALEVAFIGERFFGLQAFKEFRAADMNQQRGMISLGALTASGGLAGLKDRLIEAGTMIYWRGHMDEDELFYLRQIQARIELFRQLRTTNTGATVLKREMNSQDQELQRVMNSPIGKYRYLFSAIAIPNSLRAFDAAVQKETQRRMMITAIALKRYSLRQGHYPASLPELAPSFLAAELTDPWSGQPFHYRRNADGTFTLYSVGADGRDDGGDPVPTATVNAAPDPWAGRDVVWPTPVFPTAP